MSPWTRILRSWQNRALLTVRSTGPDCLIMATPAAGKTTFALRVAHEMLALGRVQRVVIVCPTDHLRTQWTQAAAEVGLQLDPELHGRRCVEARDYSGAVVTYAQVARSPKAFSVAPGRRRTLVVLDEIHHAADGKHWGEGLREAFAQATYRLALSGTPFRSDDTPIPFVQYVDGISRADFSYGYAEAITDRVCRPIFFPSYEGDVQWQDNQGHHRATFFEHLNQTQRGRRLKTAITRDSWLLPVLQDAIARVRQVRASGHPTAGGLVVAMDQTHARQIQQLLVRLLGCPVPMAISDDPASSQTIADFTRSGLPWLVAVRMVSEGVDIPRLRVGVYASNISTEMYFRQVIGRFVRMRPELGAPQESWLYLPKDPMLVGYAQTVEAERNHVIAFETPTEPKAPTTGRGFQASSFVPISAVAMADALFSGAGPPVVMGWDVGLGESQTVEALVDRKAGMRAIHAELVSQVARTCKLERRVVNLELIKRVGGKIEQATVDQLDRRIRLLERWREQGRIG